MSEDEEPDIQEQLREIVPTGGFVFMVAPEGDQGFSVWGYDDTAVEKDSISELHVFFRGAEEFLCNRVKEVMEAGRDKIVAQVKEFEKQMGENVVPFKGGKEKLH